MSRRPRPRTSFARRGNLRASRQRGAVLWLCVALLFAGAYGLVMLYSAGQAFTTRERLNNAADAAAYSAALWRARVLNFQAYANRAIVAQEVAVAQAVTLVSWARYFNNFTGTAAVLAAPYPPVAGILAVSRELAQGAMELAEQAAGEEIPARTAYKQLLGASQEILERAIGTFAYGAVANEVARANDPAFFAFALPGAQEGLPTRRFDGEERNRLREVVVRSLDAFVSGPRSFDLTLYLAPSLCFGNPIAGPDTWFNELHKRGGTQMAPDLDRWEAADTHSLHTYVPRRGLFGIFLGCRRAEAIPLGWGAAEAGDPSDGALQGDPGEASLNGAARSLAQGQMASSPVPGMAAYPGIAAVRDLDYAALADTRFPSTRVAVLARADARAARTADSLGLSAGRLRLADSFAAGRLWSVSAAEVFFRRPPSGADRIEYASLYSPYWQVRLAEPTEAELTAARSYVR